MEMVAVYRPKSESETAVVTALMHAYDIEHFMRGGAFGSMYPGPVSNSLNERMLMVRSDQAALARQLLADFIQD